MNTIIISTAECKRIFSAMNIAFDTFKKSASDFNSKQLAFLKANRTSTATISAREIHEDLARQGSKEC
jgi:hypothetical protein